MDDSPEVGRRREVEAEAGEITRRVREQEEDGRERRDGVQRAYQQHQLETRRPIREEQQRQTCGIVTTDFHHILRNTSREAAH